MIRILGINHSAEGDDKGHKEGAHVRPYTTLGLAALLGGCTLLGFNSCKEGNQPGTENNQQGVETVVSTGSENPNDSINFTDSIKTDNEFNKLFYDLFKKGDEEYKDRGIVYRTIKFENGAKIKLSIGRNYECIKVIFGGENKNCNISFEESFGSYIIRGSYGPSSHKKTLYLKEDIESASIELRGIIDEMYKNDGEIEIK